MSPSNQQRAVRRRALGDELLYAMRGRAACKAMSAWWVSCEIEHAAARSVVEARAAAMQVVELCGECPVRDLCETWAFTEKYSGLAAGHAWVNGRKRNPMVPVTAQKGWVRSRVAQLDWADLQELVQRLADGGERNED